MAPHISFAGAGVQFTSYVPTALVGVDSPSPTLAAEIVTGLPIPTGAFPGNTFYLNEDLAAELSKVAVNGAPQMDCHAGWYMVVQVDSAADESKIDQGYIGAQASLAQGATVVTDVSSEMALGACPVVFLNEVTAGNFTIVQIAGDANVYLKSGTVASTGETVTYAAADGGQAGVPTQSTQLTYALYPGIVGQLEETAVASDLNRVNVAFPFGVI